MTALAHTITVRELSEILVHLDPDCVLELNAVGNLIIISDEGWIGYIDLCAGLSLEERLQIQERKHNDD